MVKTIKKLLFFCSLLNISIYTSIKEMSITLIQNKTTELASLLLFPAILTVEKKACNFIGKALKKIDKQNVFSKTMPHIAKKALTVGIIATNSFFLYKKIHLNPIYSIAFQAKAFTLHSKSEVLKYSSLCTIFELALTCYPVAKKPLYKIFTSSFIKNYCFGLASALPFITTNRFYKKNKAPQNASNPVQPFIKKNIALSFSLVSTVIIELLAARIYKKPVNKTSLLIGAALASFDFATGKIGRSIDPGFHPSTFFSIIPASFMVLGLYHVIMAKLTQFNIK